MYSELNFLWEAWLKVFTNSQPEAIINATQGKGLPEYKELMTACFKEMYRILKPNRWITVVFHNSKAAVWNAIQEAMTRAGFVVAQVTVMDRKQGSFNQVVASGAVKVEEKAKRALLFPNKLLAADFVTGKNLLVYENNSLFGDLVAVFPPGREMFGKKGETAITHGGIHLEEVIIPFVEVQL